jgi:hypothetical protein
MPLHELRRLMTVSPSEDLLKRILASRAAGQRVLLPDGASDVVTVAEAQGVLDSSNSDRSVRADTVTHPAALRRIPLYLVVAASLVLVAGAAFLLTGRWSGTKVTEPVVAIGDHPDGGSKPPSVATTNVELAHWVPFWPATALAQVRPGTSGEASLPFAAMERTDLRRGFTAVRSLMVIARLSDGSVIPVRNFSIRMDSLVTNGKAVWRLVRSTSDFETRTGVETTNWACGDTLLVASHQGRALSRRFVCGQAIISEAYTSTLLVRGDTVRWDDEQLRSLRQMNRAQSRFSGRATSVRIDSSRPFVPSDVALRLTLQQALLTKEWRRSIAVRTVGTLDATKVEPGFVNLHVIDSTIISGTGGAIPCWRVQVDFGEAKETWYVSRATGETVLVESAIDEHGRRVQTYLVGGR